MDTKQQLEVARAAAYQTLATAQTEHMFGRAPERAVTEAFRAHEALAEQIGDRTNEGFAVRNFTEPTECPACGRSLYVAYRAAQLHGCADVRTLEHARDAHAPDCKWIAGEAARLAVEEKIEQSDLTKAIKKNMVDLAKNEAALKLILGGYTVANLTADGVRQNIAGLRAAITHQGMLADRQKRLGY